MSQTFAVINGDCFADSRGKFITLQGHTKAAMAINYALRTSQYISDIESTLSTTDSDDAIRWAIIQTVNDLISEQKLANWLPDTERIHDIGSLAVQQTNPTDPTTYSFTLEVNTYANTTFSVTLENS